MGRPGCGDLRCEEHVVYRPEVVIQIVVITYTFAAALSIRPLS